jgi:cell division protein FtsQ
MVKRQQRKVNVPLRKKGSEVQLPALPDFKAGWRIISGALALLSFAVVISFIGFSSFKVSAINLVDSQRLNSEAIVSQVDLIGKAIIALQPRELESQILERFPGLETAKVTTGLPAEVTIKVTDRTPVVMWQQEDASLWIDEQGVTFPVIGQADVVVTVNAKGAPPAAPIVQIEEETEEDEQQADEMPQLSLQETIYPVTSPEFVGGVLALVKFLPEDSQLQYDPQYGLGWQDPRGWTVYFGSDTTNIDMKLAEYETIIAELQKENIKPALISLEFLHAPFYR